MGQWWKDMHWMPGAQTLHTRHSMSRCQCAPFKFSVSLSPLGSMHFPLSVVVFSFSLSSPIFPLSSLSRPLFALFVSASLHQHVFYLWPSPASSFVIVYATASVCQPSICYASCLHWRVLCSTLAWLKHKNATIVTLQGCRNLSVAWQPFLILTICSYLIVFLFLGPAMFGKCL